jgi:hypothetical protein
MNRPPHLNPWGTAVNVTVCRWYPLLLLRDARGRFARLRKAAPQLPPITRARRRPIRLDAVQLVLF